MDRVGDVDCVAVARVRVDEHRDVRAGRHVTGVVDNVPQADDPAVGHPVEEPGELRPGEEEELESGPLRHHRPQRRAPAGHGHELLAVQPLTQPRAQGACVEGRRHRWGPSADERVGSGVDADEQRAASLGGEMDAPVE